MLQEPIPAFSYPSVRGGNVEFPNPISPHTFLLVTFDDSIPPAPSFTIDICDRQIGLFRTFAPDSRRYRPIS